ncbi:MAG TPA: hypothetical protein VEL74_11200 [Thermoanaerobaculia bacterium]|nr:hypothetical protein [Thermoanaerobaculia bacterium]
MKLKLLLSLALIILTAGSALAAEPVTVAPESAVTSDAAADEVALPDELAAQLTPEPTYKIGVKHGPCSVSVTCAPGWVISCSGQSICYWKVHSSWSNPGYVECDGRRTTCLLTPE